MLYTFSSRRLFSTNNNLNYYLLDHTCTPAMYPYYGYSAPSYSVPSDSEYLRALTEESAARE